MFFHSPRFMFLVRARKNDIPSAQEDSSAVSTSENEGTI
jgi:hypothetical protein